MINDEEIVQWGYLLDPAFQLINSAGKPLTNGYIEVYYHGTRTKYYCASDFDGTLHPFRIPLDSLGANIVLADPDFAYDIYIYNAFGSLVMSRYNVTPGKGGGGSGGITAADAEHWLGQYGATQQLTGSEYGVGQTLALPSRPDYQGEFIDHIDYGYINGDETNQYPKYMYLKPGIYFVNCVIRFQQKSGTEVNRLDETLVYTGNGNANEDVAWQLDETGPLANTDRHCLKLSFVRKVLDEGVTSSVDCSNILYFAPGPKVDWSDAYIQTLQIVKLGVSTAAATKYAAGDYITIIDNVIGVTGLQPVSAMDQYVTNETFNETVSAIYSDIEIVTGDIQDALDDKKDKQTPYSASGSVTKTITSISQNANGEISVTYSDIDLPPQVPQVEIVSPNDTIAVSSYTDTETNTKTFTIDVNDPDCSYWAGPTSGYGEYITDTASHLLPMDTSPYSHRGDAIRVEDGKFKLKKGIYFFHANVMLRPATAQNVRQEIYIYANSNRASYPWDRTVNSGDTTVPICGIVNATSDDYTLSFTLTADTACEFYASVYEGDVFRIDGIGAASGGGGGGEEYFPGEGIAIDQDNYIKVKIGDGLAFDEYGRLTVSGDFVSESDLEAVTSVIENTIEGVSATIIEQVSGDITIINEQIEYVSSQVDAVSANMPDTEEVQFEELDVDSLATKDDLASVSSTIMEDVSGDVTNLTEIVNNVSGDVQNITEIVNNVTGDIENITTVIEGVTGDIQYVSGQVDAVSAAIPESEEVEFEELDVGSLVTNTALEGVTSVIENRIETVSGTLQEEILAVSADAQVQSDWAEDDSNDLAYIKNKPSEVQLMPGDNISIERHNDLLVISATGVAAASAIDNLAADVESVSADVIAVSAAVDAVSANMPDTEEVTFEEFDVAALATKDELAAVTANIPSPTGYATEAELQIVSGAVDAVSAAIPASQVQSDWTESATGDPAYIKHKPDEVDVIAGDNVTLEVSGSFVVISANVPAVTGYATEAELQIVSAAIPPAQVNSDWNSSSGKSQILNKPDLTVYATNTDLQTVSAAIPPAQVQSNWSESNTSSKAYIQNKPTTLAPFNTAGITDIQYVNALPANPVSSVLYIIPET